MKCCFTPIETVGLLGTEAQDGHLDFHTAPAGVLVSVDVKQHYKKTEKLRQNLPGVGVNERYIYIYIYIYIYMRPGRPWKSPKMDENVQ